MSYKRNRTDFETLEQIAELSDQQELDAARLQLMEHPTKATAALVYDTGINQWFREHGVLAGSERIAKRRGIAPGKAGAQ